MHCCNVIPVVSVIYSDASSSISVTINVVALTGTHVRRQQVRLLSMPSFCSGRRTTCCTLELRAHLPRLLSQCLATVVLVFSIGRLEPVEEESTSSSQESLSMISHRPGHGFWSWNIWHPSEQQRFSISELLQQIRPRWFQLRCSNDKTKSDFTSCFVGFSVFWVYKLGYSCVVG